MATFPSRTAILTLASNHSSDEARLAFVYDAGSCGYVLHRKLSDSGYECQVIAHSLIPKKSEDRVMTDRRDAQMLARLHRVGELTPVWVPGTEQELMRDLSRLREDLKKQERQLKQRLSSQERAPRTLQDSQVDNQVLDMDRRSLLSPAHDPCRPPGICGRHQGESEKNRLDRNPDHSVIGFRLPSSKVHGLSRPASQRGLERGIEQTEANHENRERTCPARFGGVRLELPLSCPKESTYSSTQYRAADRDKCHCLGGPETPVLPVPASVASRKKAERGRCRCGPGTRGIHLVDRVPRQWDGPLPFLFPPQRRGHPGRIERPG